MARGYEAQYLDRIADRTFRDLLDSWIGSSYPGPSRLEPDLQKIDISHQMPSLSRDIGTLPFNWQIKARTQPPRETDSQVLGCRCFRLYVEQSYIRDLFSLCKSSPSFYLALAIVEYPDGPSLPDRPPTQRFRWYAVDIKQYCEKLDWGRLPSYIDIPIQNRLNLSLFSLMWGANWVDTFVSPLRIDIGLKPVPLELLIRSFRLGISCPGLDAQQLLREAVPHLEELRDNMPERVYANYASRLAIIGSLRGITALLKESPGAERIDTYSPEALAGSANLWLFSRTYHEFMRMTQLRGEQNKRLLPVNAASLSDPPRFFLATLFNVRAFYSILGAEVKLVRKLAEGGGNDYSFWSGAIGEFQWVQVDGDGHISLNDTRMSARREDRDRLNVAEQEVLSEGGLNVSQRGTFGTLRWSDLKLEAIPPVCLFPAEDHFIEHPLELWYPGIYPILSSKRTW